MSKKTKKQKGFTLVEVLIGIFILAISTITIYSLYNMSLKVIWLSKARITATQLANQKLEMARNLSFNDVGTSGGIPSGPIPQTEYINRNGINYTVTTEVVYIDDPYDSLISDQGIDVLTITDSNDAWAYTYGNDGSDDRMRIGNSSSASRRYRSWLKINMADELAAAGITTADQILAAELKLTILECDDNDDQQINFYSSLQNWQETQLTWNDYSTSNSWNQNGGSRTSSGVNGWNLSDFDGSYDRAYNYDFTKYTDCAGTNYELSESGESLLNRVRFWLENPEKNYGWQIQNNNENQSWSRVKPASSEHPTPNYHPQLLLTYGEEGDLLNTDYKRIRVAVSWNSQYGPQELVFLTDIAPKGVESNDGGGTLKITVFDASGQPIPQAIISIYNDDLNPIIDMTTLSNSSGIAFIPGAPESIEGYQISVTKNGYSTDSTYDTTVNLPSPSKPHVSVYEGQQTSISFSIDKFSTINGYVQDILSNVLSNIDVQVTGGKIIGQDDLGQPVYKYNQTHTSNASGQLNLTDIEWDTYTFTLDDSEPYNISDTNPQQPLNLIPDVTSGMIITLEPQNPYSLLVLVQDVDNLPVDGASVRVFTENLSLNETIITGSSGQAYFSPWENATTTIEITATGFENYSDTYIIDGYITDTVILTTP